MADNAIARFFQKPIFKNNRFILWIYAIAALATAIQVTFFLDSNNYKIFYYSLQHLQRGISMYAEYPSEYLDHYHYAPSFAVLFSAFFLLPFKAGLFCWHLFFAAVWVWGLFRLPLTKEQRAFGLWFGLQELLTALGNSQTNPLIAVIPLLAFVAFENKKPFWAAFFVLLGFNVKIYSIVAAALFILYPKKVKFILSALFWGLVLGLLPLLVTSFDRLVWQYARWLDQLVVKTDSDKFSNISIHRIVHQALSPDIHTFLIVSVGVLLFCSVYIHKHVFASRTFKMQLLASVLIFQVIFQPAAESATYITAVTGVIVWWLATPKTTLDYVLVIACFIFTVMGPTDLMPPYMKNEIIKPFVLKAWPCVLIWFRALYLMHQEGFRQWPRVAAALTGTKNPTSAHGE